MPRTDSPRIAPTLLLATLAIFAGCQRTGVRDGADDVTVDLALKPEPPKVGDATATVRLADKDGKPIHGATVKLEGNMNHAGMKPEFADAKETDAGKYDATMNFSMGGDWFILVDASLPDGRKLKRKVNVPGVRSR